MKWLNDLNEWIKMRQDAGLSTDVMACLKECQAKIAEQAAKITEQEWQLVERSRSYTLMCGKLNREILELRAALKAASTDDTYLKEILTLRARLAISADWEALYRKAVADRQSRSTVAETWLLEGYRVDGMVKVAERSIARQERIDELEKRLEAIEGNYGKVSSVA